MTRKGRERSVFDYRPPRLQPPRALRGDRGDIVRADVRGDARPGPDRIRSEPRSRLGTSRRLGRSDRRRARCRHPHEPGRAITGLRQRSRHGHDRRRQHAERHSPEPRRNPGGPAGSPSAQVRLAEIEGQDPRPRQNPPTGLAAPTRAPELSDVGSVKGRPGDPARRPTAPSRPVRPWRRCRSSRDCGRA